MLVAADSYSTETQNWQGLRPIIYVLAIESSIEFWGDAL